jgi:type IX secretion system PorP/SprF family membrane protein
VKKWFIYILFLCFLALSGKLDGQQLPIYSQYVLNGLMINPAMAGHDGYTSLNATSRQQWIGFDEAPQTYSASWQTRVLKRSYKITKKSVRKNSLKKSTKGRVGLGAYLINDANANVARTGASFTYAYHIIMNNQQLSFGLSAKMFQYRINGDKLTFGEDGDPVMDGDFRTVAYSPDADFGVFFRDRSYFMGFSISNLLQSAVMIGGNEVADFQTYRHYWLMGGYKFPLSNDLELEPTALLKTSENWNPQGELTMKLHFQELLWGGLSYRTTNSMVALLGVKIENIYFGYSFDWTFSEISHYNFGSHEITVSVKLGDNARRYKWMNRY